MGCPIPGCMKWLTLVNTLNRFPNFVTIQLSFIFGFAGSIKCFYKEEVDTRVPLERFKSIELPPNLSIQYDYHRFHPETDTKFNGVSAFPQRPTIISGLKNKKKYAGYQVKPKF